MPIFAIACKSIQLTVLPAGLVMRCDCEDQKHLAAEGKFQFVFPTRWDLMTRTILTAKKLNVDG